MLAWRDVGYLHDGALQVSICSLAVKNIYILARLTSSLPRFATIQPQFMLLVEGIAGLSSCVGVFVFCITKMVFKGYPMFFFFFLLSSDHLL